MLVHKLSAKLASWLANSIGWQDRTAVLTYGFELIIGESLKLVLLIAVSSLFGLLTPMLLILSAAVPFRLLTGGGHCTTYFRCTVVTVLLFWLLSAIVFEIYPRLQVYSALIILPVILGIGLAAIKMWVPRENPNRPINDREKIRFRKLSRIYIISWSVMCLLLYIVAPGPAFRIYFVSTSAGTLWQIFVISPLGDKFFNLTEKIFDLFLVTKEVS